MTLQVRRRPLTAAERRRVTRRLRDLQARPGRVGRGLWVAAVGVVGALWLLTLLASDASWGWITGFWVVVGGMLGLWVRRDVRRDVAHLSATAAATRRALERGEVESFDVVARAYAAFEEVEDEGACYAFDVGDGRLVVVAGQEFAPHERFPSLDFSIVHLLDDTGRPVDQWIDSRAPAHPPDQTIPAAVTWELADAIPEHLTVLRGELDRLEQILRQRTP